MGENWGSSQLRKMMKKLRDASSGNTIAPTSNDHRPEFTIGIVTLAYNS